MKNILIGLAVLVLVGGGVWFSKRSGTAETALVPGTTSYTMTQVATHNSASSCWSTINGSVYDLTNWIGKHPGGQQAILQLCGKDGSVLFNAQHGGQALQANTIETFKIGVLAQ